MCLAQAAYTCLSIQVSLTGHPHDIEVLLERALYVFADLPWAWQELSELGSVVLGCRL